MPWTFALCIVCCLQPTNCKLETGMVQSPHCEYQPAWAPAPLGCPGCGKSALTPCIQHLVVQNEFRYKLRAAAALAGMQQFQGCGPGKGGLQEDGRRQPPHAA